MKDNETEYKGYTIWQFEGDWYLRINKPTKDNYLYECINTLEMAKFLVDLLENEK
jgi:hypothetical protein